MSKIVIGTAGTHNATIDVDKLLRTRMLIQANSGKGKSWLLRRIAEQLFGKCPVMIIDPEGEFATLREKYGYVLVGKGGDTPADPRSAALLAHKLLELRASAVCDIFEMKPNQRHEWVQKFLDALIDAPKNLWHPCVVMVDEAHTFCPEKGSGESTASEARRSERHIQRIHKQFGSNEVGWDDRISRKRLGEVRELDVHLMKIKKWVDLGAEVEIEVGFEDFRSAMGEAFSNVTAHRLFDKPNRNDVIYAIDAIAKFFRALTDEQCALLTDPQRKIVSQFLREQADRFDKVSGAEIQSERNAVKTEKTSTHGGSK